MALRRMLGFSDGELMRSDAKPCSQLMRQTAGVFSFGGALGFWVLCRLHYDRIELLRIAKNPGRNQGSTWPARVKNVNAVRRSEASDAVPPPSSPLSSATSYSSSASPTISTSTPLSPPSSKPAASSRRSSTPTTSMKSPSSTTQPPPPPSSSSTPPGLSSPPFSGRRRRPHPPLRLRRREKSVQAYISRAGGHVIEVHLPFPVKSSSEIVSEFQKALQIGKSNGRKIRLAVIDHITSMPCVIIPVKELVKMCRDEGVDRIFIDGAHAIGNVEIDVKDIGADFYTSNLHKWLFCPPSAAFLYCKVSDEMSDLHHPVVSHEYGNGLAMESAWTGTRDYSAQLVLPEVMEFVSRFDGGIEGIMRRNHETVVEMAQMLVKAWGTALGAPPEMCSSMAMVGMPICLGIKSDSDALKLRKHLRECFKVEVPIYYREPLEGEVDPITGYARISHQVYNVVEDYYTFRDAVNKLVKDGFTCNLLSN
ncbi:hypothetical protein DH2020_026771 [Rehmannia glutinosa]|uniref:Aminotransferase class V domain-containing protein n=1 Tax=Rehmannia glutinosa TaxID=99300 RepID=A0ABR0VYS6_REHGL